MDSTTATETIGPFDHGRILGMELSPDLRTWWIVMENVILQRDVKTGRHTSEIPLYDPPRQNLIGLEPNCGWLVSGFNGTVLVKHSTETGRIVATRDIGDMIYCICISENGQRIAVGGYNRFCRVFDDQLQLLHEWKAHADSVISICFAGAGDDVVSGSDDSTAKRWSRDGTMLFFTLELDGPCHRVETSSAGSQLMTFTPTGSVRVWDGRTGQLAHIIREGSGMPTAIKQRVLALRLCTSFIGHEDNELMMTFAYKDPVIKIFNSRTGRLLRCWDAKVFVGHVKLFDSGRIMAISNRIQATSYTGDRQIRLYRDDALPWSDFMHFRFNGSNYRAMPTEFRQEARTFLLCCARHRREEGGVLKLLPYELRQIILIWLSRRATDPNHFF
jgi:WD40 repeat protein